MFLSGLAPLGVDISTVAPFAEALARGVVQKQELLRQAGGGLTAAQVTAALHITRQAVDKRRLRGSLLAVPTGAGSYLYPACQFTVNGVIPHLEEALQAFQVRSSWTGLSVLMGKSPALGGKSILEALQEGDTHRAIAVAGAFSEQGG